MKIKKNKNRAKKYKKHGEVLTTTMGSLDCFKEAQRAIKKL